MRRGNSAVRMFFAVGTLVGSTARPADAAEAADNSRIVSIVENDSFVHRIDDRHYTSGIYLSWTSKILTNESSYDALAHHLSIFPLDGSAKYRSGGFLGQSIFTPENLSRIVP